MNKNLENAIKLYSQGSTDFITSMAEHSKSNIIGMFNDLLTIYINDLNSSTIRETLTLILAGYERQQEKLGYNGYKIGSNKKKINCEVKPRNIRTNTKKSPTKLSGQGNFTDYTWNRFNKHKLENPNILVSGFIDGRIIYIFEFPFMTQTFTEQLESHLKKRFPKGDIPGEFLRSASFNHKHFIQDAKLIYKAEKIKTYEKLIVKTLFHHINEITPAS